MATHGGGSADVCSSDHLNHFLQKNPSSASPSSQVLESLWVADSSPSFHEPSMVNFSGIHGRNRACMRRCRSEVKNDDEVGVGGGVEADGDDDDFGNLYRQPEKKRRLTPEQVQYLERSFEVENKLEPERKNHLAKELGLQPRQVAIWFQNRRARFKTKQLERDYDVLKVNFDSLKADYDSLLKEKDKLQNEVSLLTTKLKLRETSKSNSNSPIHMERSEPAPQAVAAAMAILLPCKQEEAISAKSDVFDSESPHCTEGNYSSALETTNSSQAYEPEQSDFNQEEVEDLTRSFLPVVGEESGFHGDPHGSSCTLGLAGLEGQPSYWPWLY